MRHTIVSRQFRFIAAGEVDHLTRLELGSVDGIKSHYCFMGTNGSEGELQFTERSCYECEACFDFEKSNCQCSRYTGTLRHIEMLDNTTAKPITRAAQAALLKKAKKHIKPGMNIIIRLQQQHGSWVAAKAASKVYQLGDSKEDKEIKRSTRWNKGTWVVQVEQYEEDTANPDSSTNSTMFCLGKQRCKNWLCDCGVNADVPCHKQHRSVYKACNIREPFGFRLTVPQTRMLSQKQRKSDANSKHLRYIMPPGVLQSIENNLDPANVYAG